MNKKVVKCRSCKADIIFIKHGKKFHPVNVNPKKLFVFIKEYYDLMESGAWQLVDAYESHFATCPDAAKWRKDGKKEKASQAGHSHARPGEYYPR